MKVSLRVFDDDERKFLETILDLAARRLKVSLEHVASGAAEVVFLKADEPGASLLINASQVRHRPVVVVYGSTGYQWTLEKPATSRELVDLLSRLQVELGHDEPQVTRLAAPEPEQPPAASQTAASVSAAPSATAPRPRVVTSPARSTTLLPLLPVSSGGHVLERLREIAAGKGHWLLVLDASFMICVDAESGRVFFPAEYAHRHSEVARLSLAVQESQIRRSALDDSMWKAGVTESSMPLESFLWLLAQIAEPELPEEGEAPLDGRFRLLRWPSFSRILHGSSHIVMSGRLMKRAMTLEELVEVTGESLESVMRFYNSACICGLLQSGGEGSAASRPAMQVASSVGDVAQLQEIRRGKAGVFARVLKRLLG